VPSWRTRWRGWPRWGTTDRIRVLEADGHQRVVCRGMVREFETEVQMADLVAVSRPPTTRSTTAPVPDTGGSAPPSRTTRGWATDGMSDLECP